jgi:hypothetical protein
MILRFVVKAFEEESSLLLPEVYDRCKLLLHKNDLNIVIDSDKDMNPASMKRFEPISPLLHQI